MTESTGKWSTISNENSAFSFLVAKVDFLGQSFSICPNEPDALLNHVVTAKTSMSLHDLEDLNF